MLVAVHILGDSFPLAGESRVIQSDMIPPIRPRSLPRHDRGVLRKCDGRKNELVARNENRVDRIVHREGREEREGNRQ